MNYLDANKFISELENYYIERAKKKENTKDLKVLEEDIQSFNDFLTFYKNPIIINKRIISLFINENLKEENMAYRIKESIFLSAAFPNNLKLFYDDYIADKKDLYKLLNLFIIETK